MEEKRKVLFLNFSRKESNTNNCLHTVAKKRYNAEKDELYLYQMPNKLNDCCGCTKCFQTKECIFKDKISKLIEMIKKDIFEEIIICTPVYTDSAKASVYAFLHRLSCFNDMMPKKDLYNNINIKVIVTGGSSGTHLVGNQILASCNLLGFKTNGKDIFYNVTEWVEPNRIRGGFFEDSIFIDTSLSKPSFLQELKLY